MSRRVVMRAANRYACLLVPPVLSGALMWAMLRAGQAKRPRLQARPGGPPPRPQSMQGRSLVGAPAWPPPHCQAEGPWGVQAAAMPLEAIRDVLVVRVTFDAINPPGVVLGCLQLCSQMPVHWLLPSHRRCHASAWSVAAPVCLHSTAVRLSFQWCCCCRSAEQAKAYARGMGEALEATYETTKETAARAAERAREAGQQAAETSREATERAKESGREIAAVTTSGVDFQGGQSASGSAAGGIRWAAGTGEKGAREAAETAGSAIDRARQAARETFQAAKEKAEQGADKARKA